MEHRCSLRVPLNINTLIYKHGMPVAMGRIKNGSSHGLYLETDYQDVRELQKLELEVLLGPRSKEKARSKEKESRQGRGRYQVSALVVRKSDFGYGLELEMLSDTGSQKLREFIQQQRARRTEPEEQNKTEEQKFVMSPTAAFQHYQPRKRGPSASPRN